MSKTMNTKDIQARIQKLEAEKAKLISMRKEEIFKILEVTGGMVVDNALLAGLFVYANSEEAKNSQLLRELAKVGKSYLPSRGKSKPAAKATASVNSAIS